MNIKIDWQKITDDLGALGLSLVRQGEDYLFRSDAGLSNFIRFTVDEDKLRIKGFAVAEENRGSGLGGKIISGLFSNLSGPWTIELENNFNPAFWKHIESKYPEFTFVNVTKDYLEYYAEHPFDVEW